MFPDSYNVYRRDRDPEVKANGGGVFILVKKIYVSSEIKINTNCELLFVDLKLKGQKNVKIGCVYRPPWTDEDYIVDLEKALDEIDPQHSNNIWLGGDFNVPNVDWSDVMSTPNSPNTQLATKLIEVTNDRSLTQVVDLPTRKDNTLDLFFTSNPSLINRTITIPPLTQAADHDIVFIDVNTRASIPKQTPATKFLYKKADWASMRQEMSNYVLPTTSVQEQWNDMENFLKSLMKKFIPTKVFRPQKHKPWITREIINNIHRRDKYFKAWRKTKSEDIHHSYLVQRALCQQKIRQAHKQYLNSIFEIDSSEDNKTVANKRFWSYVKSKKKDSCTVSPLRSEGVLIADAVGKANILNKQYCSVFTKEEVPINTSKGPSQAPTMPSIKVSAEGVLRLLKDLKPHKASGPDQISTRVLKELAEPLSKPLAQFFQSTIDKGTVPAQWKKALVTPIFKKGDKHCAANYRPVSLTAVCCKLCEHILARTIMDHLEDNGLLSDSQHGFRRKRSCESQLLLFVDELAQSMCSGKQVDVAVMDFSKAFDVVPHQRLLNKLNFYGIRGNALKWIEAFLTGRTQQVVVDGEMSDIAPVTSGVPQGSVLGPILFLTFINDMPETVSSRCRLFADDSIIYREVLTESDCVSLQEDLGKLEQWEKTWGMSFNPTKCNIIHMSRKKDPLLHTYHIKGTNLEAVENATYLGINVAKDLSWNRQVSRVAAKGNRMLGFVKRNVVTTSRSTKELAYNSLVRPTMEYASSVWCPYYKNQIYDIEMVQRRAARYCLHAYTKKESVTTMLQMLKWETLEQRRLKARVVMGYRVVNDLVMIPKDQLIPNTSNTRGHHMKFQTLYAKRNYYKYTFFPSFIPLWNALPESAVSAATIDVFKDELADVVLKKPY